MTALFADPSGSTMLSEALDPAELKLIVGDAVARMVSEVEPLGGFVKDLAGGGVLAFFGAPTASKDDAERAVLAGLSIVEAMDAYGAEVHQADRLAVAQDVAAIPLPYLRDIIVVKPWVRG